MSHPMSEIASKCSRAIWIEQGRMRADGEVNAVIEKYESAVG